MSNEQAAEESAAVDFHCHACGVEVDLAPDPPARAVCENCCPDHDYVYEPSERAHLCQYCGKAREHDPCD